MSSAYSKGSSTQVKTSCSECIPWRTDHILTDHPGHSRYLEGLCDYLYDDLRPRILHEPKLGVLCQVCTVIQALMVLDVPTEFDNAQDDESDEDDEDSHMRSQSIHYPPMTPTLREVKSAFESPQSSPVQMRRHQHRQHQQLRRLHVGNLLEMILQDAQTRLVFRAQAVVQTEIRYYVPKEGDLDYPQKLLSE